MKPFFSSRDRRFRDPVGAVAAGSAVHFKISLPRALHCRGAYLVVCGDAGGDEAVSSMFWCGMDGDDREFWECHYTPQRAGLSFYYFQLDTAEGRKTLAHGAGGEGVLTPGAPWQMTVYEPSFSTPDWLAGGVIYQIFPDRFARSGVEKQGVPQDRKLHGNWYEPPEWRPDERGEVLNDDYFGGDLRGIAQKLPYLQSLGVTCLYLNPIFEAHQNHRYNTADYRRVDPLLGDEGDFRFLCEEAARYGIRVLLDGVFSHTGSDSVYFNREGRYPGAGACQSRQSPYYPWYRFTHWPDQYRAWWGFPTLPEVEETEPGFDEFINGPDGVVRHWLRLGAAGWRLDVADELPDPFLDRLRGAAKAEKEDALILGEVWEDATNKTAYGRRRRYLLGRQLDSVMNYPFREAILRYLRGGDAQGAMEAILSVLENYPPQVTRLLMNHIGTHDTERALTALAGEEPRGRGREWQAARRLTQEERARGLRLLRLAAALQYTLPGVPCVYYGDEAGMEGYRDPFNRACYPWGREDAALVSWYRALGALRAEQAVLREGGFCPLAAEGGLFAFLRVAGEDAPAPGDLCCAVNASAAAAALPLPAGWESARLLLGGELCGGELRLAPESCCIAVRGEFSLI
jgi:cyclomaltodextrinase